MVLGISLFQEVPSRFSSASTNPQDEDDIERPKQRASILSQKSEARISSRYWTEGDLFSESFKSDKNSTTETPSLAEQETKTICRLRLVVFAVLVLSALGISLAVYYFTSGLERRVFEERFAEDGKKVLQGIGSSFQRTLMGMDALVVHMVSHARATNQSWPLVTIPDFAVRAEKVLSLTAALSFNSFAYLEDAALRIEWENYTAIHGPAWVQETYEVQAHEQLFEALIEEKGFDTENVSYMNVIFNHSRLDNGTQVYTEIDRNAPGPFLPSWQAFPMSPRDYPYNWDLPQDDNALLSLVQNHAAYLTGAFMMDSETLELTTKFDELASFLQETTLVKESFEPLSVIYYPILDNAADQIQPSDQDRVDATLGGVLSSSFYWRDLLTGILPSGSNGIHVVFEHVCPREGRVGDEVVRSPYFTYQILGPDVVYLGEGDHHDEAFEHLVLSAPLLAIEINNTSRYDGVPVNPDQCPFHLHVYASKLVYDTYTTSNPQAMIILVVAVFVVTSIIFIAYDCCVEHRQRVVMHSAVRTNDLVNALYPEAFQERIFTHREEKKREKREKRKQREQEEEENTDSTGRRGGGGGANRGPNNFLASAFALPYSLVQTSQKSVVSEEDSSFPIAELFPDATVMFADLAGFTAWSSTREPSQVFILLETLYEEFDRIARRRRVFKIETIGDCYLAVAGVPTPRSDHAVVMCRFACDCRSAMNFLVRDLEHSLGPGTGDLLLRAGLHSGSVTGGVLRGEKCLFTLFGDTVNTASRMESNGKPNRIQVSQKTANLIMEAGKGEWLTKREDMIEAKGKGKMQTYWAEPARLSQSTPGLVGRDSMTAHCDGRSADRLKVSFRSSSAAAFSKSNLHSVRTKAMESADARATRRESKWWGNDKDYLPENGIETTKIDRLIDWNVNLMEGLLKKMAVLREPENQSSNNLRASFSQQSGDLLTYVDFDGSKIRDEMCDSIPIKPFTSRPPVAAEAIARTQLPLEVIEQLFAFCSSIAHDYGPNAFHSFERSSHMAMSFNKLLTRIISSKTLTQQEAHVRSFGMASDPLAHFAVIVALLVHDLEYSPCSSHCRQEDETLSAPFVEKHGNEQKSLESAWDTLMLPMYTDLRAFLFPTQRELLRFRQLLVNSVMATILFDAELEGQRERRWQEAFDFNEGADEDRQATIALEEILHVCEVCHSMQPWNIYEKWNKSYFEECMGAFVETGGGKQADSPAATWYEATLEYFDRLIIPLARKVKQRDLFGEYSPEFLDRAMENRLEWEQKGRLVVMVMKENFLEKEQQTLSNSSHHQSIKESSMTSLIASQIIEEEDGESCSSSTGGDTDDDHWGAVPTDDSILGLRPGSSSAFSTTVQSLGTVALLTADEIVKEETTALAVDDHTEERMSDSSSSPASDGAPTDVAKSSSTPQHHSGTPGDIDGTSSRANDQEENRQQSQSGLSSAAAAEDHGDQPVHNHGGENQHESLLSEQPPYYRTATERETSGLVITYTYDDSSTNDPGGDFLFNQNHDSAVGLLLQTPTASGENE